MVFVEVLIKSPTMLIVDWSGAPRAWCDVLSKPEGFRSMMRILWNQPAFGRLINPESDSLQKRKMTEASRFPDSVCPLQTPYFWPTQQWPVEDTDYGEHLGVVVGHAVFYVSLS